MKIQYPQRRLRLYEMAEGALPCVVLICITVALNAASVFFLQKAYKKDQEVQAMMSDMDFDF